jgi:hypothetical protein
LGLEMMILDVAEVVGRERPRLDLSDEVGPDLLELLTATLDDEVVETDLAELLLSLLDDDDDDDNDDDDEEGFVALELLETSLLETLIILPDVELVETGFSIPLLLLLLLDEDDLDTGRLEWLDDFIVDDIFLIDDVGLIEVGILREDVLLRVEVVLRFVDDDCVEDGLAFPSAHLQRSSSWAAEYLWKGEVVLELRVESALRLS